MEHFSFSELKLEPTQLTEEHIHSVLLVRRARNAIFGQNLFSDPAWDILLALFAAHLAGRLEPLDRLANFIQVPHSTVRRWVAALEERNLVESMEDNTDGLRLSADGAKKIQELASRWAAAFTAIS